MAKEKDYIKERIAHDVQNDPGFAETWAPFAIMGDLVKERVRLGLTQADVAERMGVGQSAVARMENNPPGVSFARILAYTQAIGAGLAVEPSKEKPQPRPRRAKKAAQEGDAAVSNYAFAR